MISPRSVSAACAFALSTIAIACSHVQSAAVSTGAGQATPWQGRMWLIAAHDPPAGADMGIAQAAGPTTIEELVPELMARGRELGGNVVRIESLTTRFELHTYPQTSTYSCGTTQAPMTCTRTTMVTGEVAITQLVGRVYRVEAWQ